MRTDKPDQFDHLFVVLYPKGVWTARRMGARRADAEELAADAFIVARDTYDETRGTRFETWYFKQVCYLTKASWKGARRRRELWEEKGHTVLANQSTVRTPDQELESPVATLEDIVAARPDVFDGLTRPQRAALEVVLHEDFSGWRSHAIDLLGVSDLEDEVTRNEVIRVENKVKRRFHRALAKLQGLVEERHALPER